MDKKEQPRKQGRFSRLAQSGHAFDMYKHQEQPPEMVVCPKPEQIKKKIIDDRIVRCIRYEEFNLHCYSCTLKDICDDPFRTDIPVPSTPASEVVSPCCKCGHSLADHSYSSICEVSGCVCIAFDAVPLNSKEG
jgi:hypothetical protein